MICFSDVAYGIANSAIQVRTPEKSQLPSQHSMLGHHRHASETPFNCVSLACQWWPAYSGIWILPPLIKNKKKKKKKKKKTTKNVVLYIVWPHLTNLSGSALKLFLWCRFCHGKQLSRSVYNRTEQHLKQSGETYTKAVRSSAATKFCVKLHLFISEQRLSCLQISWFTTKLL